MYCKDLKVVRDISTNNPVLNFSSLPNSSADVFFSMGLADAIKFAEKIIEEAKVAAQFKLEACKKIEEEMILIAYP